MSTQAGAGCRLWLEMQSCRSESTGGLLTMTETEASGSACAGAADITDPTVAPTVAMAGTKRIARRRMLGPPTRDGSRANRTFRDDSHNKFAMSGSTSFSECVFDASDTVSR